MTLKEELMKLLSPEEVEKLGPDLDLLDVEISKEEMDLYSVLYRPVIE